MSASSRSTCSATWTNRHSATTIGRLKIVPKTDGDRFEAVLSHVLGKRLTYDQVTGKVGATDSLPN